MSDPQDSPNARSLQEARERFGKPFAHERRVARTTPASAQLKRLNRLSAKAATAPASTTVVPMKRRQTP